MTLRSWRSHRIIRWSTLQWNLTEAAAWGALLSTAFAPAAQAGELLADASGAAPRAAAVTPLENLQQQSATQRWQRLKAQYGATATPTRTPLYPAAASTAPPLPDDASTDEASAAVEAAPFPAGAEEPAWIIGTPPPAPPTASTAAPAEPKPAQRAAAPATARVVQHAPQQIDESEFANPFVEDPRLAQATGEASAVAQARGQDIPPMPLGPDGRRRLRQLSEISPFYDTTVDEDIRKFAEERAAEYNVKFGDETYVPRAFPGTIFAWDAPDFYYYPLYFEDPALERYGHTYSPLVQPFVSGARFSGQLLALPYQMVLQPPFCPVYALGWYRPGECAPKLHYQIPWNGKALAAEAAVATGLIFLIP